MTTNTWYYDNEKRITESIFNIKFFSFDFWSITRINKLYLNGCSRVFQWNEVICAFRTGVPAVRHRRYMKTYEDCFTASEAVDWLHSYLKSNCNFASEVTRFVWCHGKSLKLALMKYILLNRPYFLNNIDST